MRKWRRFPGNWISRSRETGSLVLCFAEKDRDKLEKLLEQGIANGVKELRIIEKEELRQMEPDISREAVAALYAPTGGIVCPFGLTIAMAENAAVNGVEFKLETQVFSVKRKENHYLVTTSPGRGGMSCGGKCGRSLRGYLS